MNFPKNEEDFITRRTSLALQRGELAKAYCDLKKPIGYLEYGMKGFAFVRQNQWILTLAPSLMGSLPSIFNLAWIAFGRKKRKAASVNTPPFSPSAPIPPKMSRVSQAVMTGAEQCVRAYGLYRRIRSIIS